MSSAMFSYLKNLWPFYLLKDDDLKSSNKLVNRLSIPEQTKQFVFAIRDSDSHLVVYILAAQNLSQQSAIDADHLIKEVRPNAVVVSVAPSALSEIPVEEKCSTENHVPTSSFGVLKRCLFEKLKKEQYDSFAGCQVLHAIFGVGFYGHVLAAKTAAEAVDSHFLLLESPYENACVEATSTCSESGNESAKLHLQTNRLLPGKPTPAMNSSSPRRFVVSDVLQSDMVKSLIPSLDLLVSGLIVDPIAEHDRELMPPRSNYQVPPFAKSVYSLLADLHHIFKDLPSIGKALSSAQKMLVDVNRGEPVDTETLSIVQNFRIAIEGLRIALNKAARRPIDTTNSSAAEEFYELPTDEKCHVLFAQALRKQAGNFGAVVAIVDAASVGGLRRHWRTSVPPEVAELANHCVTHYCDDDDDDEEIHEKMKILRDKPVVALGAGATALLGASSLSKAMPASSMMKAAAATFHVPASFKLGLLQLKRTVSVGVSKMLVPSKLLAPGLTTGSKAPILMLSSSAEKIRAVTHGMIATAERSSLFAIRTSFYEIMRKRNVRPVGFAAWVSFGCSMGACAGLVTYGDGIECAAESVPCVSMIASLGRGLENLQQASQQVKQSSGLKMHEALQYLLHSVKRS